eukprot:SAG31_NODE_40781_length_279_cov_0.577778_1_plen_21_part_01
MAGFVLTKFSRHLYGAKSISF